MFDPLGGAGSTPLAAAQMGQSYTPGLRRSTVLGDSVLTMSDVGVKSGSLATLAERGWAAFPPAEVPKPLP